MNEKTDWREFLRKEWGIEITPVQQEQFQLYARLLQEYNQYFNLTRLATESEIYFYHFVDSLAGYYYIRQNNIRETNLLDIGSGAGFPGIPIKIVWPQSSVILVESDGRKKKFLEVVIDQLNLKKIEARNIRAEDLKPGAIPPTVATLRAVGKIFPTLAALKHLSPISWFLWYATEKLYRDNLARLARTKPAILAGDFYSWPGLKQRRLIVGIKN